MALVERAFLANVQGKFWRFDVKTIVGAVLLGIVVNLVQQVTERADAAVTGGAFTILGGISFMTLIIISAVFFRYPGALITGEVHALISIATAASPMSPAFILANFLAATAGVVMVRAFSLKEWWHWPVVSFVTTFTSMLGIAAGLWFILNLPPNVILISFLVTWLVASSVASVLVPLIAKGIDRSGVLD